MESKDQKSDIRNDWKERKGKQEKRESDRGERELKTQV